MAIFTFKRVAGATVAAGLAAGVLNYSDSIGSTWNSLWNSNKAQPQPVQTISTPAVPVTVNSNTAIILKELTVNDPTDGTNTKMQVLTAPLAALKHRHDNAMGELFNRARDAAHVGSTETTIQIDEAWGAQERKDNLAGKKLVTYDAANDAFKKPEAITCAVNAARVAEQDAINFPEASIAYRFILNEGKTDLGKEWTIMIRDIGEDIGYANINPNAAPTNSPDMAAIYECSFG
ncbi:MAG: hypothetical protein ACRBCT_07755 [Alphaproteobacteria bacterium]